ncbi:MAG: Regulator of RpoS [Candidatus Woesearchaeota archaeon]|nr:Regulator of RpoS [Candidatus Woesearchaeota archaeon]
MYTVLLANDDITSRESTREYLEMELEGIARVITVCNGKEALEYVMTKEIDLVLTDWQMPVMDGKEAAEHMRNIGYENPILIYTSAQEDLFEQLKKKAPEADEVISSFVGSQEIARTVCLYLKKLDKSSI